jgi:hypothetical protein
LRIRAKVKEQDQDCQPDACVHFQTPPSPSNLAFTASHGPVAQRDREQNTRCTKRTQEAQEIAFGKIDSCASCASCVPSPLR